MKKILYTLIAVAFVFTSCRKDSIDPGGTAVQNLSGEFWVHVTGPGVDPTAWYEIDTYNTAANLPTEMWIDDRESFWQMKGKVAVNASAGTFSGNNIQNQYYDSQFTITDGKIVKDGIKAPGSGQLTDQISFTATFSDDPGSVYKFSGYARTKFAEDDH